MSDQTPEVVELLQDAHDCIQTLHSLLPDDGKDQGTAPAWWQEGAQANVVKARHLELPAGAPIRRGQMTCSCAGGAPVVRFALETWRRMKEIVEEAHDDATGESVEHSGEDKP